MNRTSLPFYFSRATTTTKELDDVARKQGGSYDINSFEDDEWRLLSIDSVVDNEDFGRISTQSLDMLEKPSSQVAIKRSPSSCIITLFL